MTYTIVLDNNEYGWKNIIFPSFNEAIRVGKQQDMLAEIKNFLTNLLNRYDQLPDGTFSKPIHENQDRIRVHVQKDGDNYKYYFFK